jgi:hypothetical protein
VAGGNITSNLPLGRHGRYDVLPVGNRSIERDSASCDCEKLGQFKALVSSGRSMRSSKGQMNEEEAVEYNQKLCLHWLQPLCRPGGPLMRVRLCSCT